MAYLVRWDAEASIAHARQGIAAFGAAHHGHHSSLGRVLDRVVDQVAHDLDEAIAVPGHDRQPGVQVGLEFDRGGRWRRPRNDLGENVVDVDVGGAYRHPSVFHAVEVEHVADQPVDTIGVVEDVPAV